MLDKDLYYIAGLIDGEGTITLIRNKKNQTKSPSISVSSTTIEILEYLKNTLGGWISKQKKYKKHHKQSWSWKIIYNKAYEFCGLIYPYLKEPKKHLRAKFISDRYKEVTHRAGKYTNETLKLKEEFEEQFFNL